MITEEEYKAACEAKDAAESTIKQYHDEKQAAFDERWQRFRLGEEVFTLDELCFAATARCETCGAGLAYPRDCGPMHQWSCSKLLLEGVNARQPGERHSAYSFTMFSILSEDQKTRTGGATTRPDAGKSEADR